ncbi:MAG: tetratricopeptide repeat protein [Treponema sp.]|jgi:tetratricopeptide (TPR) repeat protein|nr:tetratricopeptide repeat protein [Treponema sp.]
MPKIKTEETLNVQKTLLLHAVLFFMTFSAYAQNPSSATAAALPSNTSTLARLQNGVDLYAQGLFKEALAELRYVEVRTSTDAQKAEAFYWIGITLLALKDYEAALRSMEALEKLDPKNMRIAELPYHKGRVFYYLGSFNESIALLGKFIDSLPANPNIIMDSQAYYFKSSALYWIGECLYSMGQMEKALEIFEQITDKFPNSFKYEAASYRIALIAQKQIEAELLDLLRWTHEESLKTIEEYRRREHTYEQALIAYQKRIAEILKDPQLAASVKENGQAGASAVEAEKGSQSSRLSVLRALAVDLMDEIIEAEEKPK